MIIWVIEHIQNGVMCVFDSESAANLALHNLDWEEDGYTGEIVAYRVINREEVENILAKVKGKGRELLDSRQGRNRETI